MRNLLSDLMYGGTVECSVLVFSIIHRCETHHC